jgi:predicted RNA methylase
MHFGQYAFGLFFQMYLDEIESAGKPGWPAEPSVREIRDIPAAIIEHNLYGIDIDPRAIQIASLSLMLTAKEWAMRHGVSPQEVRVRRTNLVVANAVDLGEDRLREMIAHMGPRLGSQVLQERLFKNLWDNLRNVGELGSLVQVREGVEEVLDDWVEARAREKGLTKILKRPGRANQMTFDNLLDFEDRQVARQMELERRVLEAEQIQAELLAALEAAAAGGEIDPAERLFAEDTARGLELLRLLGRRYDIVVMNPPYGSFVPKVKELVARAYPLTKNNIYAAFVDRATRIVEEHGYVGALVSSTFTTLKEFEKLRIEILLKRNPLIVMLDLGFGILDDATVEAAAIVLRGGPSS